MSQDDAFLRAVIENPDDDSLRLVYADHLEECGQLERAAFIRIQLARARGIQVGFQDGAPDASERALLKEHERQWAGPLRELGAACEFSRGFVEAISIRPEDFLAHAEDLFRLAPIRRVTLQTAMFQLDEPHLYHTSAEPLMTRLAACPELARLSAINFWHAGLGDRGVQTLAGSPFLNRLCLLDLSENEVGDVGLEALASSPRLFRLGILLLGSNRIGPAGTQALAQSAFLRGLTTLDLNNNPLGDEGVTALAGSPNLRNLADLGVARSGLGSDGARALAESEYLSRLGRLDVRDNAIGNKARQDLRVRFGKGRVRF